MAAERDLSHVAEFTWHVGRRTPEMMEFVSDMLWLLHVDGSEVVVDGIGLIVDKLRPWLALASATVLGCEHARTSGLCYLHVPDAELVYVSPFRAFMEYDHAAINDDVVHVAFSAAAWTRLCTDIVVVEMGDDGGLEQLQRAVDGDDTAVARHLAAAQWPRLSELLRHHAPTREHARDPR